MLEGELRKRIMPVLEEMPVEEKVRRGNVLLKTRPRDVEETLLQLINDEDQVVAAAAIDIARAHKIWALADDIEHVLAHRDVRDWYVFEAASWALAEKRMPAERRRELWLEPLPAVELASRLRELPLFASVSVDELFRIASTARQVRHEPGSVLLKEGEVPETIHFLLDGRVIAHQPRRRAAVIGRPRPSASPKRCRDADARDDAHGRRRGDAGDAQERAPDAARRQHRSRRAGCSPRCRRRRPGVTATEVGTVGADLGSWRRSGVSPVEKVLALQRVPLFSRVSADEMRQLAEIAKAVDWTPGAPPSRVGGGGAVAGAVGRDRAEPSAATSRRDGPRR